jgi:hypothetical protein
MIKVKRAQKVRVRVRYTLYIVNSAEIVRGEISCWWSLRSVLIAAGLLVVVVVAGREEDG